MRNDGYSEKQKKIQLESILKIERGNAFIES